MTTPRGRAKLTIVAVPDWGSGGSRSFVVKRTTVVLIILMGSLLMVGLTFMSIVGVVLGGRQAAVDDLRQENADLLARLDTMDMLSERLAGLAARETQLRFLLGLERSQDEALWQPGTPGAAAGEWNLASDTAVSPSMWPLTERGFITQSLLAGDEGGHPGIDIAVASGSYVRAAGGGEVIEAGDDPVYGRFVLIDHGDGLWSRYGHALYLVVTRGQKVRRGEVIALSGSTGQSTAPHLHFEILNNGRPVDPLSMVTPP